MDPGTSGGNLGIARLYEQLSHLFEIKQFESHEIADKAKEVEQLLEKYAPSPSLK